jgi:Uma2 family endonuclease
MSAEPEAKLEKLYRVPEDGKAEIVGGELVLMPPTGFLPGYAGDEIFASLRECARRAGQGYTLPDNVGFLVDLPNRRSFIPDAAFYVDEPTGGKFLDGAPVFAVEVRSESDCGEAAEDALKRKRDDYFASGTLVVWDVDVLRDQVVHVYRTDSPKQATIFGRGEESEAEPPVPGWVLAVDSLFPGRV